MSVVLYIGRQKRLGGRLKKIIEAKARGREIEVCTDMEDLSERIHRGTYDVDAAVLLLTTRNELEAILARKESLWGVRLIIVLSNEDRGTISEAHRLSPRFIGFTGNGFTDVASVLAKMLERSGSHIKPDKRVRARERVHRG